MPRAGAADRRSRAAAREPGIATIPTSPVVHMRLCKHTASVAGNHSTQNSTVHSTAQYIVQYSTVQHSTQYTVQYRTVQYIKAQHSTVKRRKTHTHGPPGSAGLWRSRIALQLYFLRSPFTRAGNFYCFAALLPPEYKQSGQSIALRPYFLRSPFTSIHSGVRFATDDHRAVPARPVNAGRPAGAQCPRT